MPATIRKRGKQTPAQRAASARNLKPQKAGEPGHNPTGSNKLQAARHRIAARIEEDAEGLYEKAKELADEGDGAVLRLLLQSVLPAVKTELEVTGPVTVGWEDDAPNKPKRKPTRPSKKKKVTNGSGRALH